MNKLAENALTSPERTPFQQWLIDFSVEMVEKYNGIPNERTVLLNIASLAASGDLPSNVSATVRGMGFLANAIMSIIEYAQTNGWAL